MEQTTKTYKNPKAFQMDSVRMQADGWRVINQTSHKDSYNATKGCLLGCLFLPLALFGRGKASIIVTYEREKSEAVTKEA